METCGEWVGLDSDLVLVRRKVFESEEAVGEVISDTQFEIPTTEREEARGNEEVEAVVP